MLDELKNKINADKEVLAVLPRTNVKNIQNCIKKTEYMLNQYNTLQDEIYHEMEQRYHGIVDKEFNPNIAVYHKILEELEENLYLLNEYNAPFEKIGLDKLLYQLSKFYKENLENVNQIILAIVNVFKIANIELNDKDFCYSNYASMYMKTFFQEQARENVNSENMKNCFEDIYWECPEIMKHLELNFRYLYSKNKKKFEQYFVKAKKDFLTKMNKKPDDIFDYYKQVRSEYNIMILNDEATLVRHFLDKTLSINDFLGDKIEKSIHKFVDNLTDNHQVLFLKLMDTLEEYQNYLQFQYVIEDIKKIHQEKETYKNSSIQKQKDITKKERALFKLNTKIERLYKRGKIDQIDKHSLTVSNLIHELSTLYDELTINAFGERVSQALSDECSIFDILCLAYSYKIHLIECIKNEFDGIELHDVYRKIDALKQFVLGNNNTLIDNIVMFDRRNIAMIISDKYKMLNLNVDIDSLVLDNMDSLMKEVKHILIYYVISNHGLTVNDLNFIVQSKEILNLKSKSIN